MEQDLLTLRRFSDVMGRPNSHTGLPVRSLLHRLVELRGHAREMPPEVEDLLPEYPLWQMHGDVAARLQAALADTGEEQCFARHPLRWLGKGVVQADRPLESLARHLDAAEDLLDAIENALEMSGLPGELWDTFEEIQAILEFAVRARPLAGRQLLGVLTHGVAEHGYLALANDLDQKAGDYWKAKEKTEGWREPLSPADTGSALAQAQAFEHSIFRFLQPAYWKLKKTLQARYDFSRHAVAPAWTRILADLDAEHKALDAWQALQNEPQANGASRMSSSFENKWRN
jgi:hypothetical protein